MNEKETPKEISDLEIEPLTDDDLDSVAGGTDTDSCSCCEAESYCTGGDASRIA
jgi:hypothetical protein